MVYLMQRNLFIYDFLRLSSLITSMVSISYIQRWHQGFSNIYCCCAALNMQIHRFFLHCKHNKSKKHPQRLRMMYAFVKKAVQFLLSYCLTSLHCGCFILLPKFLRKERIKTVVYSFLQIWIVHNFGSSFSTSRNIKFAVEI